MTAHFTFRPANPADAPALFAFIMQHGPNEWNYLPPDDLKAHFAQIGVDGAGAVLAEDAGKLAGFVSYCRSTKFARYQQDSGKDTAHSYICEAVADKSYAGQGLGTALLKRAVDALAAQGLREIYIDRHEENAASAGMMRKAGFVEVETFADSEHRPHGSRRTTVCVLKL